MMRFRRYRVFLAVAAVFLIFLVRLRETGDWPSYSQIQDFGFPAEKAQEAVQAITPPTSKEKLEGKIPIQAPKTKAPTPAIAKATSTAAPPPATKSSISPVESVPKVVLPDRKPVPPTKVSEEDALVDEVHAISPDGRQEQIVFSAAPTIIHWEKQAEHFPVPKESIIALPTGAPKIIPKIQHDFEDETPTAKINREKRQDMVRKEFKRAWDGYRTNAWLHDELSPVSGKFRDPFCGWAATLVDTLDTLWIMGLHDDFEDAAKAVDLIDFTTSSRADIPVFETTIRYMGGLLAAYDVSGGKYKNLLDKAVELAEILMGIFDTPNRMPDLYYRWKPAFASQPHMAGVRANLAELGSLSLEFTRLAQITKEVRYYDAIARITNALSEWQDRGTKLDGVFPDNVDASGCNRTRIVALPHMSANEQVLSPPAPEPIGFQATTDNLALPLEPAKKGVDASSAEKLAMEILPGSPPKAKIVGLEENHKTGVTKRAIEGDTVPANKTIPRATTANGMPIDMQAAKSRIDSTVGEWDCVPQGLQPANPNGMNKFSMGGGQDSTYEYFPKQYLLLGGLEDKYRKMYMKTIAAIRKHMLFRPMTKDGRDLLFSGSITTYGIPDEDAKLSADVEHLTCFVGGMVGLGAKVFGIEDDLEIAKKLADGCVWAYEMFPLGIMPESAIVMPCANSDVCPWNETAYREFIDPVEPSVRVAQIDDYFARKALRAKEEEATRKAELEAAAAPEEEMVYGSSTGVLPAGLPALNAPIGSESLKEEPASLQKRQLDMPGQPPRPKLAAVDLKDKIANPQTVPKELTPAEKAQKQKELDTAAELAAIQTTAGHPGGKGGSELPHIEPLSEDPFKPLTHEEYVDKRIKDMSLPPGFVTITSKKYILRPEAIESVWYMYRITGDPTWQDKGWNMFTSIINATSTAYGHSAISDVTKMTPYQNDEMESFWLAETLKYFYLLYSTPDTISLDEWVLNTEAHPFKRPS